MFCWFSCWLSQLVTVVVVVVIVIVIIVVAEMLEKLSHHGCGIPVEFDGVLEHLLVSIETRAM